MYVLPTESAAITGQTITLTSSNLDAAAERTALLISQAEVTVPIPVCDLVVSGVISNSSRGWLYDGAGRFRSDREGEASLTRNELEALLSAPDDRLSLMCVPWGSGERLGIDRDANGVLNGDEV